MANNPYVNKVIYGNTTVMDISDTDATESDVVNGKTFYKGSGERSTGSAVIPDISNCYETTDTAETTIDDADYFPFYDSSATAKRKSLWSNIKSVLKTYFDATYVSSVTVSSVTTSPVSGDDYRHQKIVVGKNGSITTTDIEGSIYIEKTQNSASFVFSNSLITASSAIDVYTDTWGDNPSNVTTSSGTCTVTFSSAQTRTVRIYIK